MADQEQIVTKGVSLYPRDWAALDAWAEENGLNRSAALRWILRRWLKSQLVYEAQAEVPVGYKAARRGEYEDQ